jgi:hypothetical protein
MSKKKKLSKRDKARPDLATALVNVAKAQADCNVQPDDLITREKFAKANRPAQAEYLRKMSPAGADASEAGRAV